MGKDGDATVVLAVLLCVTFDLLCQGKTVPGILVVEFRGPLSFASADHFQEADLWQVRRATSVFSASGAGEEETSCKNQSQSGCSLFWFRA